MYVHIFICLMYRYTCICILMQLPIPHYDQQPQALKAMPQDTEVVFIQNNLECMFRRGRCNHLNSINSSGLSLFTSQLLIAMDVHDLIHLDRVVTHPHGSPAATCSSSETRNSKFLSTLISKKKLEAMKRLTGINLGDG